ncbi:hypothetical protein CCO02nite_05410 [Cellulomonas composti]|uniref:Uncharacterized protein n=1 Tax=Cellulomonas composti TaxID=266130 RepID=A0A511J855_9CELL|nr:hypothetical protein CCO02nite_05410 [Cellulomonas composti]
MPVAFDRTVPPPAPEALSSPATVDNAEVVAGYFMTLFPYIDATRDFAEWRRLSGASCGYCANAVELIRDDTPPPGSSSIGGELTIHSAWGKTYRDGYYVKLQAEEQESWRIAADGAVLEYFRGPHIVSIEMLLSHHAGGWQVDGVSVDKVATVTSDGR